MKIIIMLIALALSAPAHAAAPDNDAKAAAAGNDNAKTPAVENKSGDKAAGTGKSEAAAEKPAPGEYSCKYYTVTLPDGWKAIMPPTEQQGTINAIFASGTGNPAVTMLVGQHGGAEAKVIAEMFAEQFKAPKPPVEKNGQFTFSFPLQDSTAKAYVSVQGNEFMVTTITGYQKEAMNFIRRNIKSEEYKNLLPR